MVKGDNRCGPYGYNLVSVPLNRSIQYSFFNKTYLHLFVSLYLYSQRWRMEDYIKHELISEGCSTHMPF